MPKQKKRNSLSSLGNANFTLSRLTAKMEKSMVFQERWLFFLILFYSVRKGLWEKLENSPYDHSPFDPRSGVLNYCSIGVKESWTKFKSYRTGFGCFSNYTFVFHWG
ncbi:hypothetical protein RDI58_001550 [Solanum bulbocastanum]|uniref:Uncharacterized protein n=1 Tax=Solanum bulbocastanum TaxID=147425 RepID=A0AAN8UEJ7_SOLBU